MDLIKLIVYTNSLSLEMIYDNYLFFITICIHMKYAIYLFAIVINRWSVML